jgi:arabinogalactan endo-1,4-beta-galactosidase
MIGRGAKLNEATFQVLSISYDPYWTSRKNNLELIELLSINEVSLV